MRKVFLYVLFISIILPGKIVHPQENPSEDRSLKYFNKTETGFSIGIGSFKTDVVNGIQKSVRNDEIVFTVQTVNGFKYMNKIGLGLSLGAEIWQNALLWPIYGYLSYDAKPAGNTFFANIYIGSAIGKRNATSFYQEGKGAFALSIGIGYKMKLSKKLRFMYEVFYKYQALESSYNNILMDADSVVVTRKVDYTVPLNFAGLRLGICFP